ncbi:hypothetical protein GCM10028809_60970 [Spirosoma gilvum]
MSGDDACCLGCRAVWKWYGEPDGQLWGRYCPLVRQSEQWHDLVQWPDVCNLVNGHHHLLCGLCNTYL